MLDVVEMALEHLVDVDEEVLERVAGVVLERPVDVGEVVLECLVEGHEHVDVDEGPLVDLRERSRDESRGSTCHRGRCTPARSGLAG